jgi:ClpP class serine protease
LVDRLCDCTFIGRIPHNGTSICCANCLFNLPISLCTLCDEGVGIKLFLLNIMKFLSLEHKLNLSAWYIAPAMLKAFRETVESMGDIRAGDTDILSMLVNQHQPLQISSDGIATISIDGVLGNNLSPIEKALGMVDYSDLEDELNEVDENSCKALILDCSSAGGEVQGCYELGSKIAELDIPKASFNSSLDCSACYLLSSSVDRKIVSPSSFSGSIGTTLPFVDASRMVDAMGLTVEPFHGEGEELKTAGTFGLPLSDSQREHLQNQVDECSKTFREHVSNYRDVPFKKLKGGAFLGKSAVELNLADRIGSFNDCVNYLRRKI